MSAVSTDIFSGIRGVKASMDANYIRPGVYAVLIERIKLDKSRKGERFLAVEMRNLRTIHPVHNDAGSALSQRDGENMSHLIMADGTGADMFLPNVKAMVAALTGCGAEEVDESACAQMVGPDQPFAGLVVEVEAKEIVTRSMKPFTKVVYKRPLTRKDLEDLKIEVPKDAFFPEDAKPAAAG